MTDLKKKRHRLDFRLLESILGALERKQISTIAIAAISWKQKKVGILRVMRLGSAIMPLQRLRRILIKPMPIERNL
ncbi:MAG: hypothetical protein NW220_03015 [Leptolyngbyaceae cyanobacterium bins.349]|nr:hypothetical protein [Leptolyngbyaceae cyanobacterium bins.349]